MKNLDDLSNAEGLDESITEDYSNVNWKDPLKGAREAAERAAKAAREAAQRAANAAREAADRAKKAAQDAAKNIKDTTKDIGKNISSTTKDLGKNISANTQRIKDNAKKLADKAKENAKKMREKIKEVEKKIGKELKKVAKKLQDVSDKFKDKFKNALRTPIRNLILKSIRGNIHGLATKMFAAIGTEDEIKAKKIKASFVSKAKKAYASVLTQWKKLGGSESELNDAIRTGSSKKILKNPFNRADGNNHDEFYSYIASEDYYYGADGDDEELAKAEAEKIKADEEAAAVINEDDATLEVPDEEEKISGFKAFIAKILSLFKKNKGDENPYEEGDPAADDFANQEKGDE
jgi:gas vesicle protein